jgi:uncharacterized DUF497 family protein
MSDQQRLLMIVYTEEAPDKIRIISAREATRSEEKIYAGQSDYS